MNQEKQIAQAILDAQKMHEESYQPNTEVKDLNSHLILPGEYSETHEACFIAAAKENGLSPNMWYLLNLANHWYNDIQQWAEEVLAGKQIYEQLLTGGEPWNRRN